MQKNQFKPEIEFYHLNLLDFKYANGILSIVIDIGPEKKEFEEKPFGVIEIKQPDGVREAIKTYETQIAQRTQKVPGASRTIWIHEITLKKLNGAFELHIEFFAPPHIKLKCNSCSFERFISYKDFKHEKPTVKIVKIPGLRDTFGFLKQKK